MRRVWHLVLVAFLPALIVTSIVDGLYYRVPTIPEQVTADASKPVSPTVQKDPAQMQNNTTDLPPSFEFAKKVEANVDKLTANLDEAKAVKLAKSSPKFQSVANQYTVEFNSIFNTWSFDKSANVTMSSVGVVFDVEGLNAQLVIIEDPNLTVIKQVIWENQTFHTGPAG